MPPKIYVKRARQRARQRAQYVPLEAWAAEQQAREAAQRAADEAARRRRARIQAKTRRMAAERREQRHGGGVAVLDWTGRVIFIGSRRDADIFLDRYGHRVHADVELVDNRGYCVGDTL